MQDCVHQPSYVIIKSIMTCRCIESTGSKVLYTLFVKHSPFPNAKRLHELKRCSEALFLVRWQKNAVRVLMSGKTMVAGMLGMAGALCYHDRTEAESDAPVSLASLAEAGTCVCTVASDGEVLKRLRRRERLYVSGVLAGRETKGPETA